MKVVNKVELSKDSLNQIAKAIALADIVARFPKEKNPTVPMIKDDFYYRAIEMAKAGEKIELIKA